MPIARGFVNPMISPKVFVVHANEWVARYDIKVGHHWVVRPCVKKFAEMWPANLRAASLMPLPLKCTLSRLFNQGWFGHISTAVIVRLIVALVSRSALRSLIFRAVLSWPGLCGTLHRTDGHRLRASLINASYCTETSEEWYLSESLPPHSKTTDLGLESLGRIPFTCSLICGIVAPLCG